MTATVARVYAEEELETLVVFRFSYNVVKDMPFNVWRDVLRLSSTSASVTNGVPRKVIAEEFYTLKANAPRVRQVLNGAFYRKVGV